MNKVDKKQHESTVQKKSRLIKRLQPDFWQI